ncbi:MAG: metal-dependent hydrolase [Bacteroidia bacterium]|nr:metal-dependent hydrolase [Bacteroidia bacterium]MCO5254831.1 metal-dependent hydrolase [Bacteroidota bacterium]MCZ2130924.1 metal-dependent hydrolase [Bacteroidia bacterium]
MDVTYYGQSCFGVSIADKSIVFDPFLSDNPLAKNVNLNNLLCDYLLLTHAHGDHLGDTLFFAKTKGATLVSIFEITDWASKQGATSVHPMNIGGAWTFDFGKVKMVNAVHSSGFPDGTYGGNPCGYVVQSADQTFYFAGDTALTYDMKLIGESFKLDFAFLPIGDNFTMGIDDAIKAASFVQCKKIVGMHFDTFGYIKINHQEAIDKFKQAGIELILPKIGETFNI